MTAAVVVLNPAAQAALAAAEQRIERALNGFVDMGQALTEIRDGRLYKATHGTFEAYCQERWDIGRDYADRMIAAAQVVLTIVSKGLPAPTKESQARALVAVPEPERADVWRETVERTNGKPTAKAVEEIAKERTRPTPDPGPTGAAPREPDPDLAQRVWDVLDQHGNRPFGLTVGEIWLKLDGVHSAAIPAALDELAGAGRAVVMSHAQGSEPQELRARWLPRLASKTPEPDGAVAAVPSGSGSTAAAVPGEGGAAAAPTSALARTPEQREQMVADAERDQAISNARKKAGRLVAEVSGLITEIVSGVRYGASGLVTAEMVAGLRAEADRLESYLEVRA